MRAYWVTECNENHGGVVFAESSKEAKKIGWDHMGDLFPFSEYIDLRVRRCPEVDAMYPGAAYLPAGTSKDGARIHRQAGGWSEDNGTCVCDECGLHEHELLVDSFLTDEGICTGCAVLQNGGE